MSNYNYWQNFYETFNIREPSNFALFIRNYIKKKMEVKIIVDLGCGNGRDSYFFAGKKYKVTAIDFVKTEIKHSNIQFLQKDFTKLEDIIYCDLLYSRFSLHSITSEQENDVLIWASKSIKKNGLFCIEARTTEDVLFGKGKKISEDEYIYGHYRRFIHYEKLLDKLKKNNFAVEYWGLGKKWATFKKENPALIRIVAKNLA